MQNLQGGVGIPTMFWCGQEGDYNILTMDLLGKNLEELLTYCGNKFSLKTVIMIAEQLLNNIEYIHLKGYLHRDIKPQNFMIGIGKKSHIIHVIDYGLSKRYRDAKTYEHIPYREKKPFIGLIFLFLH